jgi:hypothetical protein
LLVLVLGFFGFFFPPLLPNVSCSLAQLPVFVALASDDIWGVRKACAESLVAVSQNLQTGERADTLTKVFEKLAEDVCYPFYSTLLSFGK